MNKSIRITALLSMLAGGLLHATSEFRSPLSIARGPMHWPSKPAYQAWWYEYMPEKDAGTESLWNVHTWSAAFYRCADKAYIDPCDNKTTRKTTSLSSLWFGKEEFRGEEAFAGGIINDPVLLSTTNPYLGFARISPRFDYNERGVYWGLYADRRFGADEQWHAGGRISLPFKVIEIEQNNNVKFEETLEDVLKFNAVSSDAAADPVDVDFAARLDLLRSLMIAEMANLPDVAEGTPFPLLTDIRSLGAPIDIPNQLVIGTNRIDAPSAAENDNLPPVYVTRNNCGEIPATPFRKVPDQVFGALAADGSGGADGAVCFLDSANVDGYVSQLFTDRDAQGKLFLTPRRQVDADTIVETGRAVFQRIESVIQLLDLEDREASEFFHKNCINLNAHERIAALGDLELETYVGYGHREDWFADFILGARFPTGKKDADPRRVYFQSTGHNRHFEIRLGLDGGWKPCEWFAFELLWFYNHAFKRTEPKAAAFKGATVRNIGPTVDAKVSWDYFEFNVNFNFFHPHNPELGWVFGYELFAKRKDKVCFVCNTATDLLGRENQPLDACILEERTNAMTHKLRGETFHRWNYFELFVGGSHVLAGRNAMRESEAHIGVAVYF